MLKVITKEVDLHIKKIIRVLFKHIVRILKKLRKPRIESNI